MSSEPVIRVENLGKCYQIYDRPRDRLLQMLYRGRKQFFRDFWALRDISFNLAQGETLGVVGRNGAGKSTLLQLICGTLNPSTGCCAVRGRVSALLELGAGFNPEFTGRENIYLSALVVGMTRREIDARLEEIIDFSGIETFIEQPVKTYSSGMYVRLAFAVAAHLDPEILIVDEVLAVGDAEFQKKCLGKMGDVATEGRTVLFVSHNMAAIQKLCKESLLLKNGKISFHGDVNECVFKYLEGSINPNRNLKIKDHIESSNSNIHIEYIVINESQIDYVEIGPNSTFIDIKIVGKLKEPFKFDIEGRLFDRYDQPLAFYSPGHQTGLIHTFQEGEFIIHRKIRLPDNMNRGEYYLSLWLVHSGVESWVSIPHAVKLNVLGTPTKTGKIFDYDNGAGWLLLKGLD